MHEATSDDNEIQHRLGVKISIYSMREMFEQLIGLEQYELISEKMWLLLKRLLIQKSILMRHITLELYLLKGHLLQRCFIIKESHSQPIIKFYLTLIFSENNSNADEVFYPKSSRNQMKQIFMACILVLLNVFLRNKGYQVFVVCITLFHFSVTVDKLQY